EWLEGKKADYKLDQLTVSAVKKAGRAYLKDQNSEEGNLWVGPGPENSRKGAQAKVAKEQVKDAIRTGDRKAFNTAIKDLKDASYDPDPRGKKAGLTEAIDTAISGYKSDFKDKWD